MSIFNKNINTNNLKMHSLSLSNINQKLPKNITPKISIDKKKLKKLFFAQIPTNNSQNQNLPDIYTSLTPRQIIKPKKLFSKLSPQYRSTKNYLISTSLLSQYNNINKFDFSYFKNISSKYSPLISKRRIKAVELTDNIEKAYRNNVIIDLLKKKEKKYPKTKN